MTVLLWIVAVLGVLGLLIALTPVGLRLCFTQESLTADVTIGPFHVQAFPGKEKAASERDGERKRPPDQKKAGKPKKKGGRGSRITLSEIRLMVRQLWPPLKRALGRTRRGIRISPLQLSLVLGGEEDPAATAQLYGELHGVIWTVMPVLEQLLVIRDPYLHLDVDFDRTETTAEGTLGMSLRIGRALQIAVGIAVPALRCYLAFCKRHSTQQSEPAAAGSVN